MLTISLVRIIVATRVAALLPLRGTLAHTGVIKHDYHSDGLSAGWWAGWKTMMAIFGCISANKMAIQNLANNNNSGHQMVYLLALVARVPNVDINIRYPSMARTLSSYPPTRS